MVRENKNILNSMFKSVPRGIVLTTSWLKQRGVSYKLAWWYVKAGWFERIADGAYRVAGDDINWVGAVAALQHQLNLAVYPGGKTALQLLGKTHFVAMSIASIDLFILPKVTIPKWMSTGSFGVNFKIYQPKLFARTEADWLTETELEGQRLLTSLRG